MSPPAGSLASSSISIRKDTRGRKCLRLLVLGTGRKLTTVAPGSWIGVPGRRLAALQACTSSACRGPSGTPIIAVRYIRGYGGVLCKNAPLNESWN